MENAGSDTRLQGEVHAMMLHCAEGDPTDVPERRDRAVEEVLETAQALGATRAEMHLLVDYVFDGDVGEIDQEIGGSVVTLLGLAAFLGKDALALGRRENDRCREPAVVDKIRAKRASRRPGPLPGGERAARLYERHNWFRGSDRDLSERERDILGLILQGLTSKEAARRLGISDATVKTHRRTIMIKLGVRRASALAGVAGRLGLV